MYRIGKKDVNEVLDRFPEQKEFLKAVGKQRLETTNPEDLDERKEESEDSSEDHKLLDEISNRQAFVANDKFAKRISFAQMAKQKIDHESSTNQKHN